MYQNRHFYTRISYGLNEKKSQMVPSITKYCIVAIILVNAKGIICNVTHFNSK